MHPVGPIGSKTEHAVAGIQCAAAVVLSSCRRSIAVELRRVERVGVPGAVNGIEFNPAIRGKTALALGRIDWG